SLCPASARPDHTSIRPAMLAFDAGSRPILYPVPARVDSTFGLRCDFGGEIGLLLGNALAEGEAHEARDLDRRADLLCRGLDHLGDPAFAIDDEDLLEQHDLLIVFA